MATLVSSAAAAARKKEPRPRIRQRNRQLWRIPCSGAVLATSGRAILFFGPGGEAHAPHTTFTFVKEDMEGTNPKFDIHDENGVKWKVKLGARGSSGDRGFTLGLGRRLLRQRGLLPAGIARGKPAGSSPPGTEPRGTRRDFPERPAEAVFEGREERPATGSGAPTLSPTHKN
jgi:hypothetical protein